MNGNRQADLGIEDDLDGQAVSADDCALRYDIQGIQQDFGTHPLVLCDFGNEVTDGALRESIWRRAVKQIVHLILIAGARIHDVGEAGCDQGALLTFAMGDRDGRL